MSVFQIIVILMEKVTKNLQFVLLTIILISTIIAVGIEIKTMFLNQSVTLADLLLMFLYLEVMAMVRVFWDQQSISITLPSPVCGANKVNPPAEKFTLQCVNPNFLLFNVVMLFHFHAISLKENDPML